MDRIVGLKKLDDLIEKGVVEEHHGAWARGYVSRIDGSYIEPYSGHFGKGFVLNSPSWKSTTYYHKTYYIYK